MVKDYGRLLASDPTYSERARRVSGATRDLAEVIEPGDLQRAGLVHGSGPRVAWQAPCTLQHGQRLGGRVEALLQAAGCMLETTREATLCCGSAGTYSILQPEIAGALKARKLGNLEADAPELIATANIGCLTHLASGTTTPVKHWVELLDELLAAS
jgi:glycolate oxidase iron-sulfur subunit